MLFFVCCFSVVYLEPVCVFCVVYYCRTYVKAVRGGGSEEWGRVLWNATSHGLCGRVGPPPCVLLCFIRTDVECCIGYRGFPQGSPHHMYVYYYRTYEKAVGGGGGGGKGRTCAEGHH